jgi:hypothetical protein
MTKPVKRLTHGDSVTYGDLLKHAEIRNDDGGRTIVLNGHAVDYFGEDAFDEWIQDYWRTCAKKKEVFQIPSQEDAEGYGDGCDEDHEEEEVEDE